MAKGAPVSVETVIVPDPGPGEAVVDVRACGVCHTDLHYREGGISDDFPFLLGHEAAGVVSAVGPDVTSVAPGDVVALNQSITASDAASGTSENLTGMIESNADIQPGDSGGPLVNQYGQVVGMDTAASTGYQLSPYGGSGSGGSGSGGFGGSGSSGYGGGSSPQSGTPQVSSTPINTAMSIADQIEAGHASSTVHIGKTAFLGIEIASTATQSGGVEIAGAASGTPAAAAGLTAGDVVTSVAGTQVNSYSSIEHVLEAYHPGDKISISWTNTLGQSHTATITLGSGPSA